MIHLHSLPLGNMVIVIVQPGWYTLWDLWYGGQLKQTPPYFLLFVPDSPTASMFFVLVLIAFLLKKNWPIIESLAIVILFKYGIWTVVMNILVLLVMGSLPWEGYT